MINILFLRETLHVGSPRKANIPILIICYCFELNWYNTSTQEKHLDCGYAQEKYSFTDARCRNAPANFLISSRDDLINRI